ncbi:helix-turn-helix transcriptional regulator [Dechloromonas sp. CZR5]|uniref:helix-turn-helix domain-containing protein n=1 Tax=Dechloromonas sp. CZR5 TaxID=2608630 RepID=UPI00123D559A|nr:helix-turn-helix transcriptional regulator [Dechloromonas sp. CZR5]
MNNSCDMETIGQRVKRIRSDKGWNQSDLVRHSKLPQSTVASIENDSRTKESSALIDVAHTLGVSAYWLKTGKGEPSAHKLSQEEQTIIEGYRLLEPAAKEMWLLVAHSKISEAETKAKAA